MNSAENIKNNYKESLNGSAQHAERLLKDGQKMARQKIDDTIGDAKDKSKDVKDKMKSKAEDFKNSAASKAEDLKDKITGEDDFLSKVEKTASDYASETLAFVKKYSLYSAIGAAVLGLGIGYMIYRSMPDDKKKR